ncbi:MAG: hypothetical protein IAE77_01570 [Prosthecobacter sp.]|jgi:hypothetical protein|uniref:hypothetical protein n=1 Tax=Prosthecobacter sp. TaxID=1965333 RepID=UPI0019FC8A40|nr:hypothetical protein [Prosthecobacter sp.]MBE2282131.1 hypothetical protein [Prosthecobacter sp.]
MAVICLARFAGEKEGATSFSTADRLDDPFVELMIERGVPEEQILYLKDDEASMENIRPSFPSFWPKAPKVKP